MANKTRVTKSLNTTQQTRLRNQVCLRIHSAVKIVPNSTSGDKWHYWSYSGIIPWWGTGACEALLWPWNLVTGNNCFRFPVETFAFLWHRLSNSWQTSFKIVWSLNELAFRSVPANVDVWRSGYFQQTYHEGENFSNWFLWPQLVILDSQQKASNKKHALDHKFPCTTFVPLREDTKSCFRLRRHLPWSCFLGTQFTLDTFQAYSHHLGVLQWVRLCETCQDCHLRCVLCAPGSLRVVMSF